MTRTFERFLRSFSDEDLAAFAQERARMRPPYWNALVVALHIEADRRGLELGGELLPAASSTPKAASTRAGTA